jgi:hypothetical protein
MLALGSCRPFGTKRLFGTVFSGLASEANSCRHSVTKKVSVRFSWFSAHASGYKFHAASQANSYSIATDANDIVL